MSKHLHAVNFYGTTFGMEIDTDTPAWRKLKSSVKLESCVNRWGRVSKCFTVPYLSLAACMREAHWLVSEQKDFDYIFFDGYMDDMKIYVKYKDGFFNMKERK
jgi:hypothetical protein